MVPIIISGDSHSRSKIGCTDILILLSQDCSDKVLRMIFGFSIRELKNMHIRAWRDLADQLYNYNRLTAVSAIIISTVLHNNYTRLYSSTLHLF